MVVLRASTKICGKLTAAIFLIVPVPEDATSILSVDKPVCKPANDKVLVELVDIVVAWVKAPPSCTLPLVVANPLLAVASTFTAGELAIPFTVLVNAPLESVSALVLMIFTPVPVIPFIVVNNVLI